jgi:ribose 1,5-bisphosphokinase
MAQGQLFYLMGASGVGKDSLLDYLRMHLPPKAPVLLARRHITRPVGAGGEEHIAITPEAFRERLLVGDFAMHWRSHGNDYGIDREIDTYLANGWQVVVNGPRHYLESARRHYPTNLCPVLVTVSHDQLFERLIRHRVLQSVAKKTLTTTISQRVIG